MSGDWRTRTRGLAGRLGEPRHPSVTVTSNTADRPPTQKFSFPPKADPQEKGGAQGVTRESNYGATTTYQALCWVLSFIVTCSGSCGRWLYYSHCRDEKIKGWRMVFANG